MTTSSSRMGIVTVTEHCVSNESTTISSVFQHHCTHILLILKRFFCDWFAQLPLQPRTEYTRNETPKYDPILFLDETCHKTQSHTNRPPSIYHHSRLEKPIPPSVKLLRTCAIIPSLHYFSVIDWCCDKTDPHP